MSVGALPPSERDLFKIVSMLNQLAQGRSNSVVTATLTANAASTTITAPTCATGSAIAWMPMTANASAEIGAGTIYVTAANVLMGSFVVTHANNAQTDRTFRFLIYG